jgi:hypothetical protein
MASNAEIFVDVWILAGAFNLIDVSTRRIGDQFSVREQACTPNANCKILRYIVLTY